VLSVFNNLQIPVIPFYVSFLTLSELSVGRSSKEFDEVGLAPECAWLVVQVDVIDGVGFVALWLGCRSLTGALSLPYARSMVDR